MTEYWIQNADLSLAEEGSVKTAQDVIVAYNNFDWKHQIMREKQERGKNDSCPPGLGIFRGSADDLLHILPNMDGFASGFWTTTRDVKVLGLFKRRVSKMINFEISQEKIPAAITKFIAKDHVWLAENLRKKLL